MSNVLKMDKLLGKETNLHNYFEEAPLAEICASPSNSVVVGGNIQPPTWLKKYRSRAFVFTVNNYTEEDIERIKLIPAKYMCFGLEKGEQGTPHIQGYVRFEHQRWNSTVGAELMGSEEKLCFLEAAAGSDDDNLNYTHKSAELKFAKGKKSPGKGRSDLSDYCQAIQLGEITVRQILLSAPAMFHQYGRTFNECEEVWLSKQFRSEMTSAIWIWGPTGVGKSHTAFEGYDVGTHYNWKLNDNKWQDGYRQQKTVVINDFRGEIKYNTLLNMIDKWPWSVPRRGRPPMPFTSKRVIITSSLSPAQAYNHRDEEDSLEQLLRRMTVKNVTKRDDM